MHYLLIIFISCVLSSYSFASNTIDIYSYHSDPPFHLNNISVDLSRAWIKKYNDKQKTKPKPKLLNLRLIKRQDLNKIVKSGRPYLIMWANPLWFKNLDPNVKSTSIMFWDADVWISSIKKPIEYSVPNDLIGYTIGGRSGYFYKGVNELVNSDKIKRLDSLSDDINYQKLMNSEIDAFVMSRSSLFYWFANGLDASTIHVAQSPHDAFTRHILYSADYSHYAKAFNDFNLLLDKDSVWNKRLKFWGIVKDADPFELELEELINYPIDKPQAQ